MFDKELAETYRKCAVFFKSGAIAESIIPCISGKDVIFNIKFSRKTFVEMASYICRDISKDTASIHAKNILDLYRICVDSSGDLPNILPDYCSSCGKLYFSNNSRFNRVFHICSKCRIDECNKSLSVNDAEMQFVYLIHSKENNTVKIGNSSDPKKRLKQLQTGNNNTLTLIGLIKGDQSLERSIHKMFGDKRIKGEWFTYTKEIEDFFDTYRA